MHPPELLSDSTIVNALRSKGHKATPQRIAISRLVLGKRNHPTVQEVYNEVRRMHPTVSLATVYKTLSFLTELGVVQELPFSHKEARFDSYVEPHINLVCHRCGKINDLENHLAREIVTRIANTTRFTPTSQRLDVYGLCHRCRIK